MSVLAVVGLKREARLVEGPRIKVVIGGGNARALRGKIEAAMDAGTKGIISIGIAGALAPDLNAGDVVIAERIVTASDAYECDAGWIARLAVPLLDAVIGALLGRGMIADSVAIKATLHESTRALAVDMESHIAAQAARDRGLPFAALRAISDRADHSLPPAVKVAMRSDGGIALDAVLRSILVNPGQIPALVRTGRESEKAFAALLRCRDLLGAGLACPYLG